MQGKSDQESQYPQILSACNNLMKNPRLSLYEEVELIKRKARDAQANPGVMNQLSSDISLLIERLSSGEKSTYLKCCENAKGAEMWSETEP